MQPPLIIFAVINDVYSEALIESYFQHVADAGAYAEKLAVEYCDGDETLLAKRREQIYVKSIDVK
jgi:hypothetical protein